LETIPESSAFAKYWRITISEENSEITCSYMSVKLVFGDNSRTTCFCISVRKLRFLEKIPELNAIPAQQN
jgi:hypothetical protein